MPTLVWLSRDAAFRTAAAGPMNDSTWTSRCWYINRSSLCMAIGIEYMFAIAVASAQSPQVEAPRSQRARG